jgi:3'-phosphoadenosine 5'-phosphosulfate sulfotransferase (PAPS reductase)/FAD synthetase
MISSNEKKDCSGNVSPLNKRYYWWRPVVSAFSDVNLKGLKFVCPKCKEIGFVTTRWVKGPILKPMYILHFLRGKVKRVCGLDEEQSNQIRGKVSILESDIRLLLESRKPFVLFSGGKDSLATLIHLKEIAKKAGRQLTAVYVDTTAGLPENTQYVKNVCKYMKVKLEIVKPREDYFSLVKKWGIPSFKYRWCCRELKIRPIEEFFKTIKKPKLVFDGIRAVESNVRKQYIPIWYHPSFKCLSVSPIFYWSDERVKTVINSNGLPKTLLNSGSSTECWCGAYKTQTDFKKLYQLDRKMFHKLVKVEDENKNRYTFLYKDGKKIPLRKLEKQILKEGTIKRLKQ